MKMPKTDISVKKIWKIENIKKLRIVVNIQEIIKVLPITCNLKYSVPKKRSIGFYNGSKYDDYFIIKELDEEVKK